MFEVNTGIVVDSSTNATVHIADGNIHFWDRYAYSIYLGKNKINRFAEWIEILSALKENKEVEFKLGRRIHLFGSSEEDTSNIIIDSGMSRFVMNIKHDVIQAFVKYLKDNKDC